MGQQRLPDGHGQFLEVILLITQHTPAPPRCLQTAQGISAKSFLWQQALALCVHGSDGHFVPQKKSRCMLLKADEEMSMLANEFFFLPLPRAPGEKNLGRKSAFFLTNTPGIGSWWLRRREIESPFSNSQLYPDQGRWGPRRLDHGIISPGANAGESTLSLFLSILLHTQMIIRHVFMSKGSYLEKLA